MIIANEENAAKKLKERFLKQRSELSEEKAKLSEILTYLKRERVNDQKKILDLQRRLGYAMDEYEQDKTKLIKGDSLMGVDLNSDENNMKSKVDDILVTLKDRIVATTKDHVEDAETNRFINRLSMTTSHKGSIDSPKKIGDSPTKV